MSDRCSRSGTTQWVNGFDYPSGTVYLRSGKLAREKMPFTYFERIWVKGGHWAMVAMPPDRIPATATEEGWMAAVLAMARVASGDAATQAYAAALKRWPDNLAAAVGLANQYHARGALADAITVLRQARHRHPQSVIVLNNLAQTLSDQGRHAETLAQIDKAADPKSPFAADVRATRQLILQRMQQKPRQPIAFAEPGLSASRLGCLIAIGPRLRSRAHRHRARWFGGRRCHRRGRRLGYRRRGRFRSWCRWRNLRHLGFGRDRHGSHFRQAWQGCQYTGFAHRSHMRALLARPERGIGDQRIGRLTLGNGYADRGNSGKADEQACVFL